MFWFVLILILLGGGFYFYQRMIALEKEIRAEQAREKEQQQRASQGSEEASTAARPAVAATQRVRDFDAPLESAGEVVENPILRLVCVQPGVVQADLYAELPQLPKKQVQQMIRALVDEGKIRRERLGSSFKLYLV